ncbi:NETR-like protein, partial [Mya arenaria]
MQLDTMKKMCTDASLQGGAGLIGRALDLRQAPSCNECCSINRCNDQLCTHRQASECIDEETVDCAKMNSLFHICSANYKHASQVCPRFCGLCNITDGNWSDWTVWSACIITCGNATQARTRTCTNPAPFHGKDCEGAPSEHKVCVRVPCPNGVWSVWSGWSTCPVTCGGGISHRGRQCNHPPPSPYGTYCTGDADQTQICNNAPCGVVNGGWSRWGSWDTCSVTCGGGVQRRHRSCTNPSPSTLGHSCAGTDEQTNICNTGSCYTQVRLIGTSNTMYNQGRVEIFYNNSWWTVCDDSFDDNDAGVICGMLGFPRNGGVAKTEAYFGQGSSQERILFDELACHGNEQSIFQCHHNGLGIHNCGHGEDAGVICTTNGKIRLAGSDSYHEGRIEIFFNGRWGSVCDDGFGAGDAQVACHMLGFQRTDAVATDRFGPASSSVPIVLDDVVCSGTESSLLDCRYSTHGDEDCSHGEDVGVIC